MKPCNDHPHYKLMAEYYADRTIYFCKMLNRFSIAANPAAILALIAKAQEDAADAERFRWLLAHAARNRPIPNQSGGYTITGQIFFETTTGPTIRAAIDDAMKGENL